ncbi:uncharacterized protein METZ01_LOCUS120399 [marine metagenome]|uniref:Uncharacterized protein n=1 Tax=marine metagenome TaxID=408172 RepID=A0A381XS48_9ZZZZ
MSKSWIIDLSSFSVEAGTEDEAQEKADKLLTCSCGKPYDVEQCGIFSD